jgi:hypothetical protein
MPTTSAPTTTKYKQPETTKANICQPPLEPTPTPTIYETVTFNVASPTLSANTDMGTNLGDSNKTIRDALNKGSNSDPYYDYYNNSKNLQILIAKGLTADKLRYLSVSNNSEKDEVNNLLDKMKYSNNDSYPNLNDLGCDNNNINDIVNLNTMKCKK